MRKVVFIGPCASKKLEAMRHSVRSDVDFVITFEELWGLFDAKSITPSTCEELPEETQAATAAGRGYAIAGGVAGAIENCLKEYYPDVPVHIEHAESLAECKKVLTLAKAARSKLHDRRNGLPRRLHRRRRNQRRLRKNLQGPQKIRRQLRTKTPLTGTGNLELN